MCFWLKPKWVRFWIHVPKTQQFPWKSEGFRSDWPQTSEDKNDDLSESKKHAWAGHKTWLSGVLEFFLLTSKNFPCRVQKKCQAGSWFGAESRPGKVHGGRPNRRMRPGGIIKKCPARLLALLGQKIKLPSSQPVCHDLFLISATGPDQYRWATVFPIGPQVWHPGAAPPDPHFVDLVRTSERPPFLLKKWAQKIPESLQLFVWCVVMCADRCYAAKGVDWWSFRRFSLFFEELRQKQNFDFLRLIIQRGKRVVLFLWAPLFFFSSLLTFCTVCEVVRRVCLAQNYSVAG